MNKIKQMRENLGLSQAELGKLIGCSQQHIQRIESGNDTRPDKILLLHKVLTLPIKDILTENWKKILVAALEENIAEDNIKQFKEKDNKIYYNKIVFIVKAVEDYQNTHNIIIDTDKKANLIAGLVVKLIDTPEDKQDEVIRFALDWELNKKII